MFKLNSKIKNIGLSIIDIVLIITALSVSVYLRFEWNVPEYIIERLSNLYLPAVIMSLVSFFLFGFYRRVWRYAGIDDYILIAIAVTISIIGTYFYSLYSGFIGFASFIIAWFLLLFFIGGSRLAVRFLSEYLNRRPLGGDSRNALIVGAGEAGVMVARELKKHGPSLQMNVIGFIDDNQSKQKQIIQGVPVLGTCKDLAVVVEQKQIDEVVIAMPSAPYNVMQEIIGLCEDLKVKIKTVPGIYEILEGQVNFSNLKEVDIEDLLRRPPVKHDLLDIAAYLTGRKILVTGAGGSIGSELCRQIAQLEPDKIILLDHDENGIFYIHMELLHRFSRVNYLPIICDIKDHDALKQIFREHRPEVVFHAAAHKHVPLMEMNREEAIKNNIEGSKNIIDLAAVEKVRRFVFISTDKAVNPSSIMGATKRVVEIYLQKKARNCNSCIFCSVRFGNVLGSQGSVVLLFREQISRGGPVTVTDPEMKRYFMTIPEAVQLVIQAGALGKDGEIFVLDMGEPIRIVDLARDMIILSGLKPERDIKIEFTGLRPGEKLREELFSDRENFSVTRHERIFVAPDTAFTNEEVEVELAMLSARLNISGNVLNIILN